MAHTAIALILLLVSSIVHCQSQVDAGFFYCHHHRLPAAINGDVTVRIQQIYPDSSSIESYQNATVYKGIKII